MDWLGRLDLPSQWRRWLPYWLTSVLVGSALCGLAMLMRSVFAFFWPTAVPFGFLFPAILLATLVGRWLGGLTCFIEGGFIIWFLIRPSLEAAGLPGANGFSILVLYLFAGGSMLLIAEGYRRAQERLKREQTLRAEAETERQRLLAQELGHRIKNMLTTVQAIATQTFTEGCDEQSARKAFQDRLVALARAHDLLTAAEWTDVPLNQLVVGAISPFDSGGRFVADGPSLPLRPRQAIAVALALHELATNALKYGALSVPEGRVNIHWEGEGPSFRLNWSEERGPKVRAPQHAGFGTRLLKRNLTVELGGEVHIDYAEDGLRCQISAAAKSS